MPPLLHRIDDRAVLFESWKGRYSDSPRAISEALRLRDRPFEQLWAADGAAAELLDGTPSFPPDSRRYLEALGRARYVVTNLSMPDYFRKKAGMTYVQTWHGTPLKRIAFDIERPVFRGHAAHLAALRRDVAKWDVLISPNRFSTEIFRQAFRYDGRIIETGYPRNDVLSSPDAEGIARSVRQRLGIPARARAILYAPTWRDDESFSLELDVGRLTRQGGDDLFVLLRAHSAVATTVAADSGPRVINVSEYPDIRDLYLAADTLVTDYSSAMFDFAVTGKPMLFFTYDLVEYRDHVRGFYFDFEQEAPGPLLATTAEVHGALQEVDAVARQYAGAYERFVERFCYLEDGRAAGRVIDAVFEP
jgi:CDP-glycerol glycerophosphotransferase